MSTGREDSYAEIQNWARDHARQQERDGNRAGAESTLKVWGLEPNRVLTGASPNHQPTPMTYVFMGLLGLFLLWPILIAVGRLMRSGFQTLAAQNPLSFILPSMGTSPLRGVLGIALAAAISGAIPLLIGMVIGPGRAPRFRLVLWAVAVVLAIFTVVLGATAWSGAVRV